MADLESPEAPDDLYRYRTPDIPRSRPLMQGDVFDGVSIAALDDGLGLAMVLTHACSMRRGPHLRPRLVMGRVAPREQAISLPWKGNFSLMPLPSLLYQQPAGDWALNFEDIGSVPSAALELDRRVACLDDRGLSLLNQRHAHHFTRYAVETAVLYEQSANVLAEAELLEDWLSASLDEDAEDWEEQAVARTIEFDGFLTPLRDGLKEPARRALIRRRVQEEISRRFSGS